MNSFIPRFLLAPLCVLSLQAGAQLYFPPTDSDEWESIDPENLGWCQEIIDSLYHLLESNSTKAFILLKDGKIVLEQYFNGHQPETSWYWASAGKTLTALLVGIAQEEDYLNISEPTSDYLGEGWTSCTPEQENAITIWHQLTMTSGLNDGVADPYCTEPVCLEYLADPGERWSYHNGPYTLLDQVMENATQQTLNQYAAAKVLDPIGMNGLYLPIDYNNVFFSNARSMARFGLLILSNGNWNGTPVLSDQEYFQEMVNTSQEINKSYGYLWWLNGKESYMIPQTQFVFPGSMNVDAPDDMISAMGKDGQFINVIPSLNMVWIRMGESPDNSLVPFLFNNDIWQYINQLECEATGVLPALSGEPGLSVFPNPCSGFLQLVSNAFHESTVSYEVFNSSGNVVLRGSFSGESFRLDTHALPQGMYLLRLQSGSESFCRRVIRN